ncbi:MAG: SUMF1/EgtB/PvdO family nonheme iron enzyme [Thermoguttaceae bacterium]
MAITVEQFIERLSQSGLMSAAEISAFQDSLPPDQRPADVKALVAALYRAGKLTKYQAQAVYDGKTKGLAFGEYMVLDKLGEGGMGVVFKAKHRRMDRLVAIKILSSAAMKQAGAVERFHREVQAAAKLEHPNIVAAYDATEHQGMHYLAMQYVDGKDLASIVKDNGPMGVREAVECTLQAARGLQYAHEQGIVHRDIKPGNLLLDKKGTVKILDMGLARIAGPEAALGGPERLTTSGQVMGTCDYMAPEQAIDTHAADHRSDIYSLGCTLYRLLTGQPPYQGETLMMILLAHQQAPIPPLREARPEVPEELDAVYQRMLAKQPEDRQQSMTEVVAELETVLAMLTGQSLPAVAKAEASSAALARSLAFLQEEAPRGVPARPSKPAAAERTRPSTGPERETGSNLLGKALGALAGVRRKPLVLAGIAGGLVLLLGIVVTLTLRHGTLVIDIDEKLGRDVQVAVSHGGQKVQVVDARSGWTLSLSAGKYDLAVEGGDDQFQLDSHTITVRHGGQVKVKVTLKPPLLAVAPFDAEKAKRHQEAWAKYLGLPVEMANSIGMKLVLIPPGEFTMGEDDSAHRVKITKPFYLGKYEVTQEEWEAVLGATNNPSQFKGPKNPVESVSWGDCQVFLRRLSEKCGLPEGSYRLPTEAQWEHACRAGSMSGWFFGWSELELDEYAWYDKNSEKKTHAVGQKKANAWGLHDVYGNVWEWCEDWLDENYYKVSPQNDPPGPAAGSRRVHRGGGWYRGAGFCRSAYRGDSGPGGRIGDLGLRVLLVLAEKAAERAKMSPTTEAAQPSDGSTANKPLAFETPGFEQWRKEVAALPTEKQVDAVAKKLQELNPGFDGKVTHKIENGVVTEFGFNTDNVTDISPVRALERLRLLGCAGTWNPARSKLCDLLPLKGMPLTHLWFDSTQVSDLSPLKGMPLTKLNCSFTPVSDLSPLKGMPLTSLACYGTQVSDLSPLKGLPLRELGCWSTLVSDLSPLKGMPLTQLYCNGTPVSDLSPLEGLNLAEIAFTPKNITKGLEVIRQMKSLKTLGPVWDKRFPPAEFWKKYDAGEFNK